jgi:hypothetical protein
MDAQRSVAKEVLLRFASFFEKALDVIKPPFMKLVVVLAVVVLLYLIFAHDNISATLGVVLLVIVVLIFALLVAALQYAEMRFRYTKRTEEELKRALRDSVTELQLQAKRMEQLSARGVQIRCIEYDPPGDDLQGEFVRIDSVDEAIVDMANWTLCDEAGHRFTFPAITLRPGTYVRVWTKTGRNTATDVYWGRHQPVWNNMGDCAYLRDSQGTLIDTYRYGQS